MNSISSLFAQNSPYESSIQQILRLEGLKKNQLQVEQNQLKSQKTALSDIDSKISSLHSLLNTFIESPGEKFEPLTAVSSDPESVNVVSTAGISNPGNYSISVEQLAKEDIKLADALIQTDSDLSGSGSGSIEISVGNSTPVNINLDTNGLNNQEVLEALADEINTQLSDQLTASVFKLGDGTSKLSFKSAETGEDNLINISNQQGDLSALTFSSVHTPDQLNAKFTLDSVQFERSSNSIDDVIQGFSFDLSKTTDSTVKLNVTRNTEETRTNIEEFVNKFNEVNQIIREKTFLDGDTGARGPLQKERSIRNLSFNLRNSLALPVSSLSGTAYDSLNKVGIDLEQDGTMKIADSEALNEAIASDPEAVANLFSADDGIAATLNQQIELYTQDTGNIFDSIQNGIDRKIERLDDRIAAEERFLINKEEQLRREFSELDQVISQGQTQFNQLLNFQNKLGF